MACSIHRSSTRCADNDKDGGLSIGTSNGPSPSSAQRYEEVSKEHAKTDTEAMEFGSIIDSVENNDSSGAVLQPQYHSLFEDREDYEAFGCNSKWKNQMKEAYTEIFLPLKHKKKDEFVFDVLEDDDKYCPFSGAEQFHWPESAVKRLGYVFSRTTHLKEVKLIRVWHDDVAFLLGEPPVSHSLEKFSVEFHCPMGSFPPSDTVYDYLSRAPSLKELHMEHFELDNDTARSLSLALQENKLENLSLAWISYDWEFEYNYGALSTFLNMLDVSKLKHLRIDMIEYDLPIDALRTLFRILRSNCVLESLDLSTKFKYGDETEAAIEGLLWTLKENKSLTTINLCDFPLEEKYLEELDKILFDKSCARFVHYSNHTLQTFLPFFSEENAKKKVPESLHPLITSIKHSLSINSSKTKPYKSKTSEKESSITLRKNMKIVRFLTIGKTLDVKPFEKFSPELMPKVLEILGNTRFYLKCCTWNGRSSTPLESIFYFVRSFPSLCGYQSPEMARLSAIIDKLMKDIDKLRSENKNLREGNDSCKKRPRRS